MLKKYTYCIIHIKLFIVLHIKVYKNPTDATVCRYIFTAKLLYIVNMVQLLALFYVIKIFIYIK